MAVFQQTRNADYRAFKREVDRLLPLARGKRAATKSARDALNRTLRNLHQRFAGIESIDFFSGTGGQEAAAALATLDRLVAGQTREPARARASALSSADFQKRRWVTRPRPGVDRMACAWLIRRSIDPQATFGFVDHPADSDVPFDMYTGDFSHHGPLCTFETLAERFGLAADVAVNRIGQVVHDLDMKETRYASPEAPAVGRLVDGLRQLHADDHVLLQQGILMFEALARSFDSTDGTRTPARSSRARRSRKQTRRRS